MAVPELVPQVAEVEGGTVGGGERLVSGEGFEHLQVRGLGLVPAGEQPVHGWHRGLRRDDDVGPALARMHDGLRKLRQLWEARYA